MPSSPTMLSGYTNLSVTDSNTTTAAEGDGINGFVYDGAVVWHLTRCLLLAGATVTSSSTRTTGTGAVANNLTATDQWSSGSAACAYQSSHWGCKITLGGVQFNLSFQVGGVAVGGVRINMSVGAGNEYSDSGGSVSVTRIKTVTGGTLVTPDPTSGGTDASPVFSALLTTGGNFVINACWDSATGYFFFEMHPAAGGTKASNGFVFAILPFSSNTFVSTRSDRVFLVAPLTVLDFAYFTESSVNARAVYYCRQGLTGPSPTINAVKPQARSGLETMAVDPGASAYKTNVTVSWKRDGAPADTGGITADLIGLGQVIAVPTMLDVLADPNTPGTKYRYLCLGNLAVRVPNSLVSA